MTHKKTGQFINNQPGSIRRKNNDDHAVGFGSRAFQP